ncbi:MAG: hypothetical protein QM715_03085 [Nibricoccus sp.]
MKIALLILVACLIGMSYHCQQKVHARKVVANAKPDACGFIPLPPPNDDDPHKVIIWSPLNCPSEAGRKSDALAEALKKAGIPCVQIAQVSFPGMNSDQLVIIDKVFTWENPIVFVNMRVKSRPTIDETIAEYRQISKASSANLTKKPKIY